MAIERSEADWVEQAEAQAILEAAARDNTPLMRMLRPNPRIIQPLFVALGLVAAVTLAFPVVGIVRGLQLVAWGFFWAGLFAGFPLFCVSVAAAAGAESPTDRSAVAVWLLRDAAASGDAELAPPIETQPEPPRTEEPHDGHHTFWGVRWVDNRRRRRWGFAALGAFSLYGAVNVLLIPLSILWPALHDFSSLFGNVGLSIFAIPFAVVAILQSRGIEVIADDQGLRWRHRFRGRTEERVAWSEVRSFWRVMLRNDSTFRPQPLYVLDAGAHIFAWGPAASQSRIARVPPEAFLRLIVTQTGLPVRDATTLAYTIQRTLRGTLAPLISGTLVVPPGSPKIRIPGLALALQPTASQRKRARLLKRLAWTPLRAFGLFYAAGILLALTQYIRVHDVVK